MLKNSLESIKVKVLSEEKKIIGKIMAIRKLIFCYFSEWQ